MPLDAAILNQQIHEFDDFKRILRPYINIDGEDLVHEHINNDQFEVIAGINDAFDWPNEENWVNWRQALRKKFAYKPLSPQTIQILQENNLEWIMGAPYFVHVSRDDQNLVAYSPDRNDLLRLDTTQKIKIGRLLQNELGINNDALVRRITNAGRLSEYTFGVHFTGEEIAHAYEHCTAGSCMNGDHRGWLFEDHPVRVYESPDLALLTVRNKNGGRNGNKWTGRALVNLRQPNVVRRYGNETLDLFFETAGLKPPPDQQRHFQHGSLNKCRLRHLTNDDGQFVMPSIDSPFEKLVLEYDDELIGYWRLLQETPDSVTGLVSTTSRVTCGYLRTNEYRRSTSTHPASGWRFGGWHPNDVTPYWQALKDEDAALEDTLAARKQSLISLCQEINEQGADNAVPQVFQIPWNARPAEVIVQCHFCNRDLRPGEVVQHPVLGPLCDAEALTTAKGPPDHETWPVNADGDYLNVPEAWTVGVYGEDFMHETRVWKDNHHAPNWFDTHYEHCTGTDLWIDIRYGSLNNDGEFYHNSFFWEKDASIHSSEAFEMAMAGHAGVDKDEGLVLPIAPEVDPFQCTFHDWFEWLVGVSLRRINEHGQDPAAVIESVNFLIYFENEDDYYDDVDVDERNNFWTPFNQQIRTKLRERINEALQENVPF